MRKPSVTSGTAQACGWLPPSRIRWYMGKACYGLLENGIRVKKGDEMQKFPTQAVLADDIISVEGGKNLEQLSQARKKDHVFEITNMAIERVPVVEMPLFSDLQNNFLASLHREVLRIAKLENAGKEVALVTTISFGRPIKVLGDEHSVNLKKTRKVWIWYGTSK